MNKIELEAEKKIKDAIIKHDEIIMGKEIVKLMKAFLQDKVQLVALDTIAEQYVTVPIYSDKNEPFIFNDKTLKKVYGELAGVEQYDLDEAKGRVKKLLDSLKNP